MIPLHAHQDGLVMNQLVNVLWPTLVMDLVQELHAKTIVDQSHQSKKINTDAILLTIFVKNAQRMMIRVAHQIEALSAQTAKTQILQDFTNVIELTRTTHNANHATARTLPAA